MKYLSVCSGIEAASVAWHPLGWEPVAFSEIDPFPSSVLAHHYPDVPNWGDLNDYRNWPDATFDVLVGGTPCQSFSVAGLRKGMEDPRGNLALAFCGVAARYRPTRFVWENVPGVLSSHGGRDFGALIGAMVELGYGIAWRVLDAQYVRVESHPRAVPQRRRRVFVVGYLGDWRRAAEILFEPEGLLGHPPPRRKAGQDIAGPTDGGPEGGLLPEVANPLTHRMHKGINTTADEGQTPIPTYTQAVADPITAHEGKTYTHEGKNNFRTRNVTACFNETQVTSPTNRSSCRPDRAEALNSEQKAPSVAVSLRGREGGNMPEIDETGATPALRTGGGGSGNPMVLGQMAVRRLTPLECERLQGFPDNYTALGSDTARYKALGNSMAVNVMRWIGNRMAES